MLASYTLLFAIGPLNPVGLAPDLLGERRGATREKNANSDQGWREVRYYAKMFGIRLDTDASDAGSRRLQVTLIGAHAFDTKEWKISVASREGQFTIENRIGSPFEGVERRSPAEVERLISQKMARFHWVINEDYVLERAPKPAKRLPPGVNAWKAIFRDSSGKVRQRPTARFQFDHYRDMFIFVELKWQPTFESPSSVIRRVPKQS